MYSSDLETTVPWMNTTDTRAAAKHDWQKLSGADDRT